MKGQFYCGIDPSVQETGGYYRLEKTGGINPGWKPGTCVKTSNVCDGKPDCPLAQDETNCGMHLCVAYLLLKK